MHLSLSARQWKIDFHRKVTTLHNVIKFTSILDIIRNGVVKSQNEMNVVEILQNNAVDIYYYTRCRCYAFDDTSRGGYRKGRTFVRWIERRWKRRLGWNFEGVHCCFTRRNYIDLRVLSKHRLLYSHWLVFAVPPRRIVPYRTIPPLRGSLYPEKTELTITLVVEDDIL